MMEKKMENCLRECLGRTEMENMAIPDQKFLLLANQELRGRKNRKRAGFGRLLGQQLTSIGWKIWLCQAVVVVFAAKILNVFSENAYVSPRRIALLLCSFALLVFFTAVPVVYRSARYRMAEVEAATKLSSVRLLLAKLILIGVGDVAMLGSAAGIIAARTSFGVGNAALYLLFPFLAASCIGLLLLRHMPPEKYPVCSLGLCLGMFIFMIWLNEYYPRFYELTLTAGNAGICAALLLAAAVQFLGLFRSTDELAYRWSVWEN